MRISKEVEKAIVDTFKLNGLRTGTHGIPPIGYEWEEEDIFFVEYIWVANVGGFFGEQINLANISILGEDDKRSHKGLLLIPSIFGLSQSREYISNSIEGIDLVGEDLVANTLKNANLLPHKMETSQMREGVPKPDFKITTITRNTIGHLQHLGDTKDEGINQIWETLIDTTRRFVATYNHPKINQYFSKFPHKGY